MTGMAIGKSGETAIAAWLESVGVKGKLQKHTENFDLLVGDKRVELKTSVYSERRRGWQFNIHRHGVLDERGIFAYVFRLEGAPGCPEPIHLVFKAPLNRVTVPISIRSLCRKFQHAIENTGVFGVPPKRNAAWVTDWAQIGPTHKERREARREEIRKACETRIGSITVLNPFFNTDCSLETSQLTNVEYDVWMAINQFASIGGRTPVPREIAAITQRSQSAVSDALRSMEPKGFVKCHRVNTSVKSYQIARFSPEQNVVPFPAGGGEGYPSAGLFTGWGC